MHQSIQRLTKVAMAGLGFLVLASLAMPRQAAADEVFDSPSSPDLIPATSTIFGARSPPSAPRTRTATMPQRLMRPGRRISTHLRFLTTRLRTVSPVAPPPRSAHAFSARMRLPSA